MKARAEGRRRGECDLCSARKLAKLCPQRSRSYAKAGAPQRRKLPKLRVLRAHAREGRAREGAKGAKEAEVGRAAERVFIRYDGPQEGGCRTGNSCLTAEAVLAMPTEVARMRSPLPMLRKVGPSVRIDHFANAFDVVDFAREQNFEVIV